MPKSLIITHRQKYVFNGFDFLKSPSDIKHI